jgi:hypothetical protein
MSRFRVVLERLLQGTHLPIAFYLGFIGLMLAFSPEANLTNPIPLWLAWPWMASFVGGAVAIFWGTASERSRLESVGHAFHLFGLALFVALLYVTGAADGIALAALSAVSLMRMRTLKRSRRAKREATRLLREEAL